MLSLPSVHIAPNRLVAILLSALMPWLIATSGLGQTAGVDDRAERYLDAYMLNNEGERLEKEGDYEGALQQFSAAAPIFDRIAQLHPTWESNMIAMRRNKLRQSISRVQANLMKNPSAPAAPVVGTGSSLPAPPTVPVLPAESAVSGNPPPVGSWGGAAAGDGGLPSLSNVFQQYDQQVRERFDALQRKNLEMEGALGKWQQWFQWASQEIQTTRQEKEGLARRNGEVEQRITQMQRELQAGQATQDQIDLLLKEKAALLALEAQNEQRLKAAQAAAGEASRRLAVASAEMAQVKIERDETRRQLVAMTREREIVVQERDAATQERDAAAKERDMAVQERDVIAKERDVVVKERDAATQQRDVLAKERDAATQERDAAAKERDVVTKERDEATQQRDLVTKQRDLATQERDQVLLANRTLEKQLSEIRMEDGDRVIQQLQTENERLRGELANAQRQMTQLREDVTTRDTEIAALRGELTNIQTQLVALRKENTAYQTQVSELTTQLKDLQTMAEKAPKDPDQALLAAENDVLRGIILRQLRTQARQQAAKALVIGELRRLETQSATLVKQVEELSDLRLTLTTDEEKLFTDPQMRQLLEQHGTTVQATLIANRDDESTAMDEAEEVTVAILLKRGELAIEAKKYDNAVAAFEEVLRAEPRNSEGLIGLGRSHQLAGRLAEAEVALKKCLAYDPENGKAYFHLGMTLYRDDRLNDALRAFENSLERSPKQEIAHHYLGIIASRLKQSARAEKEFRTALAINPEFGPANFNLAVLYASWEPPQKDKARVEYASAVNKGVKPDPGLEKMLEN